MGSFCTNSPHNIYLLFHSRNKWHDVHEIRKLVCAYVSKMCKEADKYYNIPAVYISEISHKSLRNKLGALPSQFLAAGFLLSYILGYFTGWRTTSLICSGVSMLAAFLSLLLPETPYWLIQHDRMQDAQ